jgi:multidrug efflux pump subunit AcrA (membrane-fusion protein)
LYADEKSVTHGFLREPYGKITEFDAPGAGKTAGLGTRATSINPEGAGAFAGDYVAYDASGKPVDRGFVRIPACKDRHSEDRQEQ